MIKFTPIFISTLVYLIIHFFSKQSQESPLSDEDKEDSSQYSRTDSQLDSLKGSIKVISDDK